MDAGEDGADKVGEKFVTYCDTLREMSAFENVKEGEKLEVVQNESNVIVNDVDTTKVMVFLTKVSEKFKEEMDGDRVQYMCDFIGAKGEEQYDRVSDLVKQIAFNYTHVPYVPPKPKPKKRKPKSPSQAGGDRRQGKKSRKVSHLIAPLKVKRRKMTDSDTKARVKFAKRAPEVEDPAEVDETFTAFVQGMMEDLGAKRLHAAADLRLTEGNYGLVREVMEKAYLAYPQYTRWHCKKLAEICLPNEHSVKNFLLLRYRRDNNGNSPAWDAKKESRQSNMPRRTPYDEAKGLGCSKCRYGKNGCNSCGYWTEEDIALMDKAKAAKAREAQLKKELAKQKRLAKSGMTLKAPVKKKGMASPKKKLRIKQVKDGSSKGLIKKLLIKNVGTGGIKKPGSGSSKKRSEMRKIKMHREMEERRKQNEERVQKNLDQVSCARLIPYTKTWKQDYYNTKYHVSKTTIAKRSKKDCNKKPEPKRKAVAAHNPYLKRVEQRKDWQDLVKIGKSPVHAWGLFASEKIEKGTRIIEYIGELTRASLANKRENYYESNGMDSSYLFRVGRNLIDATLRGGPARYINHSCDPNCKPKQFTSENKIVLFATKDIQAGEELCYDYKFDFENDERRVPCHCGASNCRGWMN